MTLLRADADVPAVADAVYRVGAPVLAATRADARARYLPVRLVATFSRCFPGEEVDYDEESHTYMDAVACAYGFSYDPELVAGRRVTALKDMALPLWRDAAALGGRIGRIAFAHAAPDCDAHFSAACFLADAATGDPLVFSLSDQGTTVPFTAVRVLAEQLRRTDDGPPPDGERALVLACDASGLPWRTEPGTRLADRDCSVGLLLEGTDGPDGVLLCQAAGLSSDQAGEALTGFLAAVEDRWGGPVTLVAGPGLGDVAVVAAVAAVVEAVVEAVVSGDVAGRACTSVWSVLHDLPPRAGAVVVAEFDPVLGYLCALATPGACA